VSEYQTREREDETQDSSAKVDYAYPVEALILLLDWFNASARACEASADALAPVLAISCVTPNNSDLSSEISLRCRLACSASCSSCSVIVAVEFGRVGR
jgi:hypothetical protein